MPVVPSLVASASIVWYLATVERHRKCGILLRRENPAEALSELVLREVEEVEGQRWLNCFG